MKFPIELRFKLLAFASRIYVRDANGTLMLYVHQKMFKLKEDVRVFGDADQRHQIFGIRADRILDIAAEYTITETETGARLGFIKRHGLRSFWRAHYNIQGADGVAFTVREESVWIRVLDGVLGQLPVVGLLTGYVFHAAYLITRAGTDNPVLRVVKTPALFEGRFRVEARGALSDAEQRLLVLGVLMMVLLERQRG